MEDYNEIKLRLNPLFEAEPAVGLVYLFGSRAAGKVGRLSDYDFAIYFSEPDEVKRNRSLFNLSAAISKKLSSDAIDAHSLNDINSPELKYHIIHDGILIFEREPFRAIEEPKILSEYFDFTYLLKKYGLTKIK